MVILYNAQSEKSERYRRTELNTQNVTKIKVNATRCEVK